VCGADGCAHPVALPAERSYLFEPETLRTTLKKIAEYTRAGFTGAGELVAALRMGGHAA